MRDGEAQRRKMTELVPHSKNSKLRSSQPRPQPLKVLKSTVIVISKMIFLETADIEEDVFGQYQILPSPILRSEHSC